MSEEKKGPDAPDAGTPAPSQPTAAPRGRGIDRRDVLRGLSTVPALGLFGYAWTKQRGYEQAQKARAEADKPAPPKDLKEVNVALLGAGAQGQVLTDAMLRIPGLRFRAVCDIWTEYNQKRVVNTLRKFKYDVNGYEDYREMLDKEKDLDAVVIATPDFWHSQHAVDCLKAGKHVYCEKEMSNTLEGARAMVLAARETGKLLQIGHQRRSHPRYRFAYEKLLGEAKILGRVVTVNGQWNRSVSLDLGWPERYTIPDARLRQYGFDGMAQFRNWRWYRGKGGGPIVDLGSHQIDIYNWFLGANPSYVSASGGLLYHDPKTHEWYDTVMVVYEYETKEGPAQAYYQTQTTNGSQGYFENFMGDQGTLVISESEANYPGFLYRDPQAPPWDEWVRRGWVSAPKIQEKKEEEEGAVLDVRESVSPDLHRVPVVLRDPYHQPHLQNFFDAVRGTATLNCPAEDGYQTAVTVLKVNEAVDAKQRLSFKPEDFQV
jgi:predicted dehydrogenase